MPELSLAQPVDEPQAALTDTCANCGGDIVRRGPDSTKWRHINGSVTCGVWRPGDRGGRCYCRSNRAGHPRGPDCEMVVEL
jgi:hypothetical protein